jgi:C-terminal processing protease CtpA/Prc
MIVSKIDANSEANKSGVHAGDHLVMVNDRDIRYQPYQETLTLVRSLPNCKMTFIPGTTF